MLKFTELNLEKKRDLVKAHEANTRAKKNNLKRKLDSPTPINSPTPSAPSTQPESSGDGPSKESKCAKVEEQPSNAPAQPSTPASQQPPRKAKGKKREGSVEATTSAVASTSAKSSEEPKPPDNTVETEDQFYAKVEVKIKIPDELKPFLVNDWDYLTRQRKLVILPSRTTVDQVITDYVKAKTANKPASHKENAILEVTSGLREYFNVMLGSQLLYKFEREQHADILKEHPDTPMCKVYGPIHFLRLFVKLGGMLTYTPLDDKSIQLLLYYIHDFLLYMKKNVSNLFMTEDYGTAPPEYHRRAL